MNRLAGLSAIAAANAARASTSIFEVIDLAPRAADRKVARHASSVARRFLFDGILIPMSLIGLRICPSWAG
jgi:hypothetical protein